MPTDAKLYSDVVPATGLLACAVLALSLSPTTVLTGAIVLVVGAGFRLVWRRI